MSFPISVASGGTVTITATRTSGGTAALIAGIFAVPVVPFHANLSSAEPDELANGLEAVFTTPASVP
jgi:hypothetical protein